jgi:nucleotide-binding universal stress UspA family protein
MKILIATDGSDFSKAAVRKACEFIVDPAKARIRVVSAYEDSYPIAAEPFAVSADFYQQIIDAARNQCEQFVNDAKEIIGEHFKNTQVDVSTAVLRGSPEQRIVEEAANWIAEIIVVGSHGRGFWGRMLGSVSDAIVHHAPCSVLVVRNGKPG